MSNATDTTSTDTTSTATSSSIASVTDVTVTSIVSSSISSDVITETSTITSASSTFVSTLEVTSSSTVLISSVYVTPSTTYVAPSTTSRASVSVVEVTSIVTETPTSNGGTAPPTVITLTSTAPAVVPTPAITSTSEGASASSSRPSALSASGANSSSSSGLSSGGKIAIAVVIPIVAIALAFVFGLFCYRRRQKRKSEEAMRQKEMAEYGFNPNNDPTLAPVGGAYTDTVSEEADEGAGYRGWGTTSSTQRKPSTTMGSGSRGAVGGIAMSESSSNPGVYGGIGSDQYSGDTVTNGAGLGAGAAAAGAGAGALGAAAAARRRSQTDINRGPSNASSAYSTGHARSEMSDDMPGVPGPYYHEEVPYNIYNEQQPSNGAYGGAQPVIQNVGARRDTRIERVPTFPQQQAGNPSIAQNF